jgi:protein-S-isoprenylcysteine O-methyltransferase Ste14
MAVVALVSYIVYALLAFGWRSWLQYRRTGSTGFKGVSGALGSVEWVAGVLFVVALAMGAAAPILDLSGALEPVEALDGTTGHVIGLTLYAIGLAGTLYAQVAMGTSWRIGVDETERVELVTAGPFSHVRNPIFSAMLPTSLGLTLMVPNAAALVGFAALVIALELQVRLVEEPYLRRTQGQAYADYASRVGRFVPGLGKAHGEPRAAQPR